MRFPYSIRGMLFAPALVILLFILKGLCPASAGNMCFADSFATPVFLPLVAVYKMFGYAPKATYQEFAFILLYWAFVGFLVGYAVDLMRHKEEPPLAGIDMLPLQGSATPQPVPATPLSLPVRPPVTPIVKATPAIPGQKPPINLLDREEYK